MEVNINKYMTVKEYAERNNISVQAVYQSVKRNTIEFKKIGSLVLIKSKG